MEVFWKFWQLLWIRSQGQCPEIEVFMITRKSFFIRWLLFRDEKEPQMEKSVIDIEHIQSGNSQRVSTLDEASLWMQEIEADGEEKVEE
ncbi:MAG: hypothetical protein IPN69_01665 [Acidobacteria bacterium]|nr:hypothetical protein [Acidobacteriota bacterium]